jgi:hypothetical protein
MLRAPFARLHSGRRISLGLRKPVPCTPFSISTRDGNPPMTISILRPAALAALALAAVGCDQGRSNPGDAVVRIVNAAPGFDTVQVYRENVTTSQNGFAFQGGTEATWDEDTYDLSAYVNNLATGRLDQLVTAPQQVLAANLYDIVVVQHGDGAELKIVEVAPPAAGASDTQVLALHAAESLPGMDLFLEAPGADIAGAVPWGSIGFLGTLPPRNVAAGDYQLTVTAAGDRTSVIFKSGTFTLGAAASTLLVVTPDDTGVSPVSVTFVQGGAPSVLLDQNAPAALRVINGAGDGGARDVAVASQFTPPLFAAVPFAATTDYASLAAGAELKVNVTPPGNPGVLEIDTTLTPLPGRSYTMLVSGPAGTLTQLISTDDNRHLLREARLRFYNAANQFTGVDFVVILPGVELATTPPTAVLGPGAMSVAVSAVPAEYDVYLRQSGTASTVLAGPVRVTVGAGGVYGVLATNGADATTATITLTDDFP